MKTIVTFLSVVISLALGVTTLSAELVGKDDHATEYDCYVSGNASCHVEDYDQASASFRQCVTLNPDYYPARVNLGVALARMGRFKEAIVDTYGQWILEMVPGQDDQVLAYYRVYTDPGHIPWGAGWIVEGLTKSSVPDIIKKTRERMRDLSR